MMFGVKPLLYNIHHNNPKKEIVEFPSILPTGRLLIREIKNAFLLFCGRYKRCFEENILNWEQTLLLPTDFLGSLNQDDLPEVY